MKTAPIIVLSERRTKNADYVVAWTKHALRVWCCGRKSFWRRPRAKRMKRSPPNSTPRNRPSDVGERGLPACERPGIEKDASRPGRTPAITAETVTRIVRKTTQEKPETATHWSTRSMAKAVGVSKATVQRVWAAHGLKPHLTRTFKLSNDPHFEEKLVDVVGLYLNPPEHALVLCADEKTSIQALDRTQRGLPIHRGRCGTMTHDYKRNGTTTLFAAIEMAEGKLIGTCMSKHRHQEWIKFLKLIDAETPAELDLHLIVDNYATHKHPKVKAWLKRHPRFHIHFIPTSSSWLNLVERWFREITDKRIRRGTFRSVEQLIRGDHGLH